MIFLFLLFCVHASLCNFVGHTTSTECRCSSTVNSFLFRLPRVLSSVSPRPALSGLGSLQVMGFMVCVYSVRVQM